MILGINEFSNFRKNNFEFERVTSRLLFILADNITEAINKKYFTAYYHRIMSEEIFANTEPGAGPLLQMKLPFTNPKQESSQTFMSPLLHSLSNHQTPLQLKPCLGSQSSQENQQPSTDLTPNSTKEPCNPLQIDRDLRLPQDMSEFLKNFMRKKSNFSPQNFLAKDDANDHDVSLTAGGKMDIEESGLCISTRKKIGLFSDCSTRESLTPSVLEDNSGKKVENDSQPTRSNVSNITDVLENFIQPNDKHSSLIQ